jgi:ABC-type dipeptide/oligopeptide/nickel transport system permease subunit
VPGAMLVMTVLALNVLGDGVRDAFDPRSRASWGARRP